MQMNKNNVVIIIISRPEGMGIYTCRISGSALCFLAVDTCSDIIMKTARHLPMSNTSVFPLRNTRNTIRGD